MRRKAKSQIHRKHQHHFRKNHKNQNVQKESLTLFDKVTLQTSHVLESASHYVQQIATSAPAYISQLLPSFQRQKVTFWNGWLEKMLKTLFHTEILNRTLSGLPTIDAAEVSLLVSEMKEALSPSFKPFQWMPDLNDNCEQRESSLYNYTCDPYFSKIADKVAYAVAEWGAYIEPSQFSSEVLQTCLKEMLTGEQFKKTIDQFQLDQHSMNFCEVKKTFPGADYFIALWRTYGFSEEQCKALTDKFYDQLSGCFNSTQSEAQNDYLDPDSKQETGFYDYISGQETNEMGPIEKSILYGALLIEATFVLYFCTKALCCPKQQDAWKAVLATTTVSVVSAGFIALATMKP